MDGGNGRWRSGRVLDAGIETVEDCAEGQETALWPLLP